MDKYDGRLHIPQCANPVYGSETVSLFTRIALVTLSECQGFYYRGKLNDTLFTYNTIFTNHPSCRWTMTRKILPQLYHHYEGFGQHQLSIFITRKFYERDSL